MTSMPERHIPNEVRVELVRSVIVRHRPPQIGLESIDDLTVVSGCANRFKSIDAFGVGANVYRFGVRVIEVKLQSSRHGVPQGQLQPVVAAVAAGLPSIQRRELRLVVAERYTVRLHEAAEIIGTCAGTTGETERIQVFQGKGFISSIAIIQIVNILAGGGIGDCIEARRAT